MPKALYTLLIDNRCSFHSRTSTWNKLTSRICLAVNLIGSLKWTTSTASFKMQIFQRARLIANSVGDEKAKRWRNLLLAGIWRIFCVKDKYFYVQKTPLQEQHNCGCFQASKFAMRSSIKITSFESRWWVIILEFQWIYSFENRQVVQLIGDVYANLTKRLHMS